MTGTTVEVNRQVLLGKLRAVLLGKLRAVKAAAVDEHKTATARYPGEMEKWNAKVASELTKLAGKMNGKPLAGFEVGYRGGKLTVPIRVGEIPTKPTLNICRIDRAIELVSLTKADTFRLRTDDPILELIVPDRC